MKGCDSFLDHDVVEAVIRNNELPIGSGHEGERRQVQGVECTKGLVRSVLAEAFDGDLQDARV